MVLQALKALDPSSAPERDGFSGAFHKAYFSAYFTPLLLEFIRQFSETGRLPESLCEGMPRCVPKEQECVAVGKQCPIALFTCKTKWLTGAIPKSKYPPRAPSSSSVFDSQQMPNRPALMREAEDVYRKEIARLERESHRLHLEAIRATEIATTTERLHRDATHKLNQELKRQKFIIDRLTHKLKAYEVEMEALSRRCEETTHRLSRRDPVSRQRIAITDKVGALPQVLAYDAQHKRVLSMPQADSQDQKLLQTLRNLEGQLVLLQQQNEGLEQRCAQLTADKVLLTDKVAVREAEMDRLSGKLETEGRTAESIVAEQRREQNELSWQSLQEQIQLLHLQLEQTEGALRDKMQDYAALEERYEALYQQSGAPPPQPQGAPTAPSPPESPAAAPPQPQGVPIAPAPPESPAATVQEAPPALPKEPPAAASVQGIPATAHDVPVAAATQPQTAAVSTVSVVGHGDERASPAPGEQPRPAAQPEPLADAGSGLQQPSDEQKTQLFETQLMVLSSKLQEAKMKEVALQQQNEELEGKLSLFNQEFHKHHMAFEIMIEQHQGLQAEIADKQRQLDAANERQHRLATVEQAYQECKQQLQECLAREAAQQAERLKEHTRMQHTVEVESQVAQLNASIERLQQELQQQTAEVAKKHQLYLELDRTRDALEDEYDELKASKKALQQQQEALAAENAQLTAFIGTMKAEAEQHARHLQERAIISSQQQERAQVIVAENERLQQDKEQLTAKIFEVTQDLEAIRGTNSLLMAELEKINHDREGLKNDLQDSMTKVVEADQAIASKDHQLQDVVHSYQRLRDEYESVGAALNRSQRELQGFQQLNLNNETELGACRGKLQESEQNCTKLLIDLNALQHQNSALGNQLLEARQTMENLAAERTQLKEGVQALKEVVQQKEAMMLKAHQDSAIYVNRVAELQQNMSETDTKLSALENQTLQLSQENDSLKQILTEMRVRKAEAQQTAEQQREVALNLEQLLQNLELESDKHQRCHAEVLIRLQETDAAFNEQQRINNDLRRQMEQQHAQFIQTDQTFAHAQTPPSRTSPVSHGSL